MSLDFSISITSFYLCYFGFLSSSELDSVTVLLVSWMIFLLEVYVVAVSMGLVSGVASATG